LQLLNQIKTDFDQNIFVVVFNLEHYENFKTNPNKDISFLGMVGFEMEWVYSELAGAGSKNNYLFGGHTVLV